jgi:hypothetical protein
VFIADPGTVAATVRVTSISSQKAGQPATRTVPPGTTTRIDVPSTAKEASTYVESFGAWVAVSWLTLATSKGGTGVGAEPCAPATAATRWYSADASTVEGEKSTLIVMNPYDSTAIFDVVLYTPDQAPIHKTELTDVVLGAHRSTTFSLDQTVALEASVGAEVDVRVGRVAVATTTVVPSLGGIRSVLGSTQTGGIALLPAAGGNGQSSVALTVPGPDGVRLNGLLLSKEGSQAVAGLSDAAQDPGTTGRYDVVTAGPSSVLVQIQQATKGSFVAALDAIGPGSDTAATAGAVAAATEWVVLPTVAGDPSMPGLIVTDPGTEPATVTLHLLADPGSGAASDVTLHLSAGGSAAAPAAFLASAPGAGVLVTSSPGAVVAAGASTSLGNKGLAGYAIAMGLPVPAGA